MCTADAGDSEKGVGTISIFSCGMAFSPGFYGFSVYKEENAFVKIGGNLPFSGVHFNDHPITVIAGLDPAIHRWTPGSSPGVTKKAISDC
jgi:hypothetical protein